MSNVSGGGSSDFTFGSWMNKMVLGENGVAYADSSTRVTAFDKNSGATLWTYAATFPNLVNAIAGGGVTVNASGLLVTLDAHGVPTASSGVSAQSATPFYPGFWAGTLNNSFAEFSGPSDSFASSIWPVLYGDPQGQHQAMKKVELQVFTVAEAQVSSSYIQNKVKDGIALWNLRAGIVLDWDGTIQPPVPGCDPNAPPPGCTLGGPTDITNVTSLAALNEVTRRFPAAEQGSKLLFVNQVGDDGGKDGYTTPENQNSKGISNVSIFRNNSTIKVLVAHELGHQFMGPGHSASPINLMCGPSGDPIWDSFTLCISSITNRLNSDQIQTARKTAALLAEQ